MLPIAATIALGAADENIAEELHLDLLETSAATFLALTDGGIKAEGAGVESTLFGDFGLGEDFADVVERANIEIGRAHV